MASVEVNKLLAKNKLTKRKKDVITITNTAAEKNTDGSKKKRRKKLKELPPISLLGLHRLPKNDSRRINRYVSDFEKISAEIIIYISSMTKGCRRYGRQCDYVIFLSL